MSNISRIFRIKMADPAVRVSRRFPSRFSIPSSVLSYVILFLLWHGCTAVALAEVLSNPFFAMDTGTHDATHKTPEDQVALARETGFAGVGPTYRNDPDLQQWITACDKYHEKLFALYMPLQLDDVSGSLKSIQKAAEALHGRETLLWLFVTDKENQPSATNHDAEAVLALQEVAQIAKNAGLRVALYPHMGVYVQRVEDAVRLVEKTRRDNVGVTFNLCHWLKVDGKDLNATLDTAQKHLFCVTLNGADTGGTSWKQLIQPLDQGTYDVKPLLAKLHAMNYPGPVGLQLYGVGGDAGANLKHSMEAWKKLTGPTSP